MTRPVSIETVSKVIAGLFAYGYPKLHRAARALGASPRTLQRRLGEAGLSYRELVDQCRLDAAREMLEESNIPVSEIGVRLGYADPSSFSRFFVCSTGMAPRTYRLERARGTTPRNERS